MPCDDVIESTHFLMRPPVIIPPSREHLMAVAFYECEVKYLRLCGRVFTYDMAIELARRGCSVGTEQTREWLLTGVDANMFTMVITVSGLVTTKHTHIVIVCGCTSPAEAIVVNTT